jgi:hypothetical protein
MTAKLAMTVSVKIMDTQRCVCRTKLFQFNGTSSEDAPDRARLGSFPWTTADECRQVLAGQRGPRRHQVGRGAFEYDPPAVVARARP